jgi:plastocyanin
VTIKVTREENKPDLAQVKVGEEVVFINATGGGHAHVSFEGNDAVQFNVGHGSSQVKFERPGTSLYAVHLSGGKGPQPHGNGGREKARDPRRRRVDDMKRTL